MSLWVGQCEEGEVSELDLDEKEMPDFD